MISVTSTMTWLGRQVTDAVFGTLDSRMVAAGNRGLAVMRALAPVDTGRLRAGEGFQVVNHTLTFYFEAPYDIYQEFGTRNIMPHPHIRPGLQAIGRVLGFDLELQFNRTGGSQWGGIHATGGMAVVPRGLSGKQIAHVRRHVAPGIAGHHRGNVRRARMVVRRFD